MGRRELGRRDLTFGRAVYQGGGQVGVHEALKASRTKTLALDTAGMSLLAGRRQRAEEAAALAGVTLAEDSYVLRSSDPAGQCTDHRTL